LLLICSSLSFSTFVLFGHHFLFIIIWSSNTATLSLTLSPIKDTLLEENIYQLLNWFKLCLLCPFDNVRHVPRNLRKTVRPKKCHQKAIEMASAIFLVSTLFTFSFGSMQFIRKKEWKCWILFILLSKTPSQFQRQSWFEQEISTTNTLQFQLYIFLYEL